MTSFFKLLMVSKLRLKVNLLTYMPKLGGINARKNIYNNYVAAV